MNCSPLFHFHASVFLEKEISDVGLVRFFSMRSSLAADMIILREAMLVRYGRQRMGTGRLYKELILTKYL